jgi:RimJ/RimL family protein N-acetyltransferase
VIGAEVVVREAEPGDASALVALARAVTAEPEGWLLSEEGWRSVGDERRYLRALRRYPNAVVLLAEEDGEVVGRVSAARDPHPASSHVADVGLMVAATHRRRGIGTALLESVEPWARATGIRKLELHVFPHNTAAIALYERLGYRREGVRRAHYRRGGELVDAVLMAKLMDR